MTLTSTERLEEAQEASGGTGPKGVVFAHGGAPAIGRPRDLWVLGPHLLLCGDARVPDACAAAPRNEGRVRLHRPTLQCAHRRPHPHPPPQLHDGRGEMNSPKFTGFLRTIFRMLVAHSTNGLVSARLTSMRPSRSAMEVLRREGRHRTHNVSRLGRKTHGRMIGLGMSADAPAESLYRRHHPRREADACEHAEHEHGGPDDCADRPNCQQFGPPQASRTGSLRTEATIAAPVPIASASRTTMSVVIFTTPLHLKQCRERERVGCYGGPQKSPLSDFLGLLSLVHLGFAQCVARRQPRCGVTTPKQGHGAGAGSGMVTRWHPAVQV
jgi:hypothetical protein